VARKTQFIKELERLLDINLPKLKIVKAAGEVAVPQKTLSKLEDRIDNAAGTIFIDDRRIFKNILLIDDAIGSGATLNETARKIKEKGLAKKVIGLAITGSFKGFDVISEI
jgi:predicted amidophosphoribosyltransferase